MKKFFYYLAGIPIPKVSVSLILLFVIASISSFSCNENSNYVDDPCGCDSETIVRYENVEGTVGRSGEDYLIQLFISDGTITVKPCLELDDKFKREWISVMVTGVLKNMCDESTPNIKLGGGHPFVIEKMESLSLQE